jgi:O-antigen ligase
VPGTEDAPGTTQFGRAFHSIYFEVLGEQGYPGLVMFLAITASTFWKLRRVSKKARAHPDLAWLGGLSDAVQSGLMVFMTSGAFVGIAFQPMFWYFIALGVSINAYLWRVEHPETGRPGVPQLPARALEPLAVPDWRSRRAQPGPNRGFPRQ